MRFLPDITGEVFYHLFCKTKAESCGSLQNLSGLPLVVNLLLVNNNQNSSLDELIGLKGNYHECNNGLKG